jgi:hypothetical protein
MNRRLRLGLIVAILVVVAVVTTIGSLILIQQHYAFLERRVPPPTRPLPGDVELFYVANAIISTINIALLVILIVIYVNIYAKTRSPFTIGLVIFALVFLVRDLTSSPFVTAIYGFRAYGLGPFAFLPSLFELVALSVLLYLSVKY